MTSHSSRTRCQLRAIAELTALAQNLRVPLWLRGGWAVDFYVGRVTRTHRDIDWFAEAGTAEVLVRALLDQGFTDATTAPREQQVDLVGGDIDHGIAFITIDSDGEALVAGGPAAGEPWPAGMLAGPESSLDEVTTRIVGPRAQIEIKQMLPTWNPCLRRRDFDAQDIALIEEAMTAPSRRPGPLH